MTTGLMIGMEKYAQRLTASSHDRPIERLPGGKSENEEQEHKKAGMGKAVPLRTSSNSSSEFLAGRARNVIFNQR